MKKLLVLCLALCLCISTVGCTFLTQTHQGNIVLNESEAPDSSEQSVTASSDSPSSDTTSDPIQTPSATTTSKVVSVVSKPDIVISQITTPDGEKAVEITVSKPGTSDDDSSDSDNKPSGPALPPSIEDLEDLHGPDTVEPETVTSAPTGSSDNDNTVTSDNPSSDTTTSDTTQGDNSGPKEHTPLDFKQRYRYNLLDLHEKVLYSQIVNAAESFTYKITFKQSRTFESVAAVLDAVIADNPHLFYLSMSCTILHDGLENAGGMYLNFSDGTNTNKDADGYCVEVSSSLKSSILAKKTAFDAKTKSILSKIDPTLPDAEKEKAIYDEILLNAKYNTSASWTNAVPDDWTAYGVLVKGKGVCESYSEAFQHLCLMAGINCTVVRGDAGGAHQWNAVQLDNEWYECDITFDDPINNSPLLAFLYHNYFNLTTERMRQLNHVPYSNEPSPTATGTKYSYKNYFSN